MEMASTMYLVTYYLEWNDGTSSGGKITFSKKNLRKVFDRLYEKVVTGPIADHELYTPEMINEIRIGITRQQLKK